MAWILLNTRKAELTRSINDLNHEKLQLMREIRNLTSFSSAIADGNVTPDELSTLSSSYAAQAISDGGVNENAYEYASNMAESAAQSYISQYSTLAEDDYYKNSALMQKVNLFWDPETGGLDETQIKADLFERYLKEYANKYIEPELKAYEDEYEERKQDLETQIQSMEAELQQLDEKISSNIQQGTIKLS